MQDRVGVLILAYADENEHEQLNGVVDIVVLDLGLLENGRASLEKNDEQIARRISRWLSEM